MPAPDRVPPIKIMPDATRFPKGIVDHYSAAEVDALLAGLPSGVQSGVHDGPIPQPSVPTPQALEDAFVDFEDGLHYFKDAGSLVAITRQDYQTTITITGPTKSVAKIVKSDAGLPTPQNPSYLVQQGPDGKWMKLTSDEINTPFGPPQMVDLFALTGGGTVDLSGYYTKPDVDAKVAALQRGVDDANLGVQSVADQIPFVAEQIGTQTEAKLALKADTTNPNQIIRANKFESEQLFVGQIDFVPADWRIAVARDENLERQLILQKGPIGTPVDYIAVKADLLSHYTKAEVDAKLEADKDFSIANDNVLLSQITSLQEIISNLGELGTSQIEVLAVIRGVEIEPSAIKFTDNATSPIQWKGGLSLVPVKDGADWRLGWNDGKSVHSLFSFSDFTAENIGLVLGGETLAVNGLNVTGGVLNFQADFALARDGSRLAVQEGSGPLERVAYLSDITPPDLSNYVEKPVVTLIQTQMQALFDSVYTRPESDDRYAAKSNNAQSLLAKVVTAQGYGFGDKNEPPAALTYTDTGEGYGERLVFATGANIDYITMKSDLEPLAALLPRVEAVEAAQGLATGGKLSIEDPVFAELKKSILDAVAKQAVGDPRFDPPADIPWTGLRTGMFIQMMGGFIELKGIVPITKTSSGFVLATIPDRFPLPNADASYPVACREVGVAVRYGYITVSATSRDITFSPGGAINELTVNGIRFKAKWS